MGALEVLLEDNVDDGLFVQPLQAPCRRMLVVRDRKAREDEVHLAMLSECYTCVDERVKLLILALE